MKTRISSFAFILILCGCASSQKKTQLEEVTKMYSRALKATDRTALLSMVHPENRKDFGRQASKLDSILFSDADIKQIYPDEDMNSAVVLMDIEYFSQTGSGVTAGLRQYLWSYDLEKKMWLLKEKSPFGQAVNPD